MSAAEWYRARLATWTATRDAATRAATFLSRLRLVTFLGGAGLVWWAVKAADPQRAIAATLAAAAFVGFTALVFRHARVLNEVERAEMALRLNAHGLARLARDWHALPEVALPSTLDLDAHPYARDLDLFGHASLTKWLGTPATAEGARYLCDWLLAPAEPATIAERQQAVDELAARREWRESLAIEGALTTVRPAEMGRFLEWVEGTDIAVPRWTQLMAYLLPLATWSLFAAFWFDATDGAWFLIPLVLSIAVSFGFAPRLYAVFGRATLGQRALERYGTMLALACGPPWSSPALGRLKADLCAGGDAPSRVKRLARIGGWSELRTGAALLHFPIQSLTLWDFHVFFALERWRARSGRHVRGWLEALGSVDALAVLSRVRADQPDWAVASVDPQAQALGGTAVGHPLISDDRRVTNDVTIGPRGTLLLITGSNMSGKSTLLRAVGLNTVLAQAGAPVCASAFTMPPSNVQTSIRVQDSLELGLSYFMAALARLKQIVDAAERGAGPGRVIFYLLDEVLQGTNSIERGLAVRAVVRHLLDAGALGVMTTHDLALADEEPIKSAAQLAHFTEQVHADGTMTFDYRLRPGIATSTNALRLMQLIGIAPK